MARYTESRELVQAIGREILAEGRAVTNAEVAAQILTRTGRRVSPNLLTEELQRFWALIGTELAERHRIPELPASLATAAQAFWTQAVQEADKRWAERQAELETAREQAQARADSLASQLDAAQAQYREAEGLLATERGARAQLEAQRHELVEHNAALEQARDALAAQARAALDRLESVQQAITWQQQAHETALGAAEARLAQAQEMVTGQAQALTAADAAQQALARDLDAARTMLDEERLQRTAEHARAERLVLQIQVLERQERAARRMRPGPARRSRKG
jgi:chromosome segregation ATPase